MNTVSLWFTENWKPSQENLVRCLEAIGLEPSDLDCVQEVEDCVRIQLVAASAYKIPAEQGFNWKKEDGTNEYAVVTANGRMLRSVTVQNLPPEADKEEVMLPMEEFGRVLKVREDRFKDGPFKGIRNGDRKVLMILKKEIPSFIRVKNVEVKVSYPGQPKTCRKCGGTGHFRAACRTQPESAARRNDSEASQPEPATPSDGDVAASGSPPPGLPAADAQRAAGSHDQHQHPVTAAARGGVLRDQEFERLRGKLRMMASGEEWKPGRELNEQKIEPKKKKEKRKLQTDVLKFK